MAFVGQVVCSHRKSEGHEGSCEVLRLRLSRARFESKKGSRNGAGAAMQTATIKSTRCTNIGAINVGKAMLREEFSMCLLSLEQTRGVCERRAEKEGDECCSQCCGGGQFGRMMCMYVCMYGCVYVC